jgi:PKD repeat protein
MDGPYTAYEGNAAVFTDLFTALSTDPVATPTSWDWTFVDGGSAVVQNPSHV